MLLMPRGGRYVVAAGGGFVPTDDASIVSYYDPSNPANYTVVDVSGTDYVSAATDLAGSNDLVTHQAGPSAGNIEHMTVGTMNGLGCWVSTTTNYTVPRALKDTSFTGITGGTWMASAAIDTGASFTWRDEAYLGFDQGSPTFGNTSFRRSFTTDSTTTFDGAVDFSGTGFPTDSNLSGGPLTAGPMVVQIVFDATANEVYVYVDGVLEGTYTGYTADFNPNRVVIGANSIPNRGTPSGQAVKFGGFTLTTDISAGNRADHLSWLQQWVP